MRIHTAIAGLTFGLAVVSTPISAQPVTLSDLKGAVVEASVTLDQRVKRGDQEFSNQFRQDVNIRFGADSIDWTITPTVTGPRGTRQGDVRSGKSVLGRPQESRRLGGGDSVWLFADGTLTTLRTYTEAGGYKRSIAFARSGGGITCTARETFMRETGVGRIALRSGIDDVPTTVLSARQVSSSCRVTKP
jgi:hypothetical protein